MMRHKINLRWVALLACFALLISSAFLVGTPAVCLNCDTVGTHFRGMDVSADIDVNGVLTLTVNTRWRKGTLDDPALGGGVAAWRFGRTAFACWQTDNFVTLEPPPRLELFRLGEVLPVYSWPQDSFTIADTTWATNTANPAYDERTQLLVVPLGPIGPGGPTQIAPPLNLAHGDYEIRWNDWSRLNGIQNLPLNVGCSSLASGFGFRVLVHWDGTVRHSPVVASGILPVVVRGFDYSVNLNASDEDGDPLGYTFAPLSPVYPHFGPATQVPGLTLSQDGQLSISAASTAGLLDNSLGEPGGDYLVKVQISDATGFMTELDTLLDVVTSANNPPVLAPIGSLSIDPTLPTMFTVTATDPDPGQTLTLSATDLPLGASFDPATGVFAWTPTIDQIGTYTVSFTVTDSGTPEAAFQDILSDSESVTITVMSAGDKVSAMMADVEDMPIDPQVSKPLIKKLEIILAAIESNHLPAACANLQSFINLVASFENSQKLTPAQADQLIGDALTVMSVLGC